MNRLLALTSAVALMASPAVALAQTNTTPPSESSSTMTGKMSEALIKQKLEREGYSDIKLQHESATSGSGTSTPGTAEASKPEYTGTATKNGKTVDIDVNSEGQVTEK
ncbi:MAG TPA: hypothetical protein VMA53_25105 [Stellaceae bacterium]|nr:hypothetical protein [Stellaceae bacterium]